MAKEENKIEFRVGIIGMGVGGESMAKLFYDDPYIEIVGVCDHKEEASGMRWAKGMGFFTTTDYKKLLEIKELDILFDATGSTKMGKELENVSRPGLEIVKGNSAKMMWRIVEDREDRERAAQISLVEQKLLYEIGIMLSNMEKSDQALKLIVESAIDLLEMSAGAVALFDEEQGTMKVEVAIGFKDPEASNISWKLNPGGFTGSILSNTEATVIEDIDNEKRFKTQHLKDQGFKSVIAVPLRAERKIVGILYADDFRPRKFTQRDLNQMGLLGTMAAAAIEKLLALERAEEMAIKDELTKIFNHRYFVRSMTAELKRAQRYGDMLSFCMLDVDHFKNFNDTHGHLQGNEVLIKVAEILTETVRDTDVVARYGGEEFAVILPKTDKKMAFNFAERLRKAIESYPFPGEEKQPNGKLTVSIGLASYPEDGAETKDVMGLIELADQALYKAKAAGRNCVIAFKK